MNRLYIHNSIIVIDACIKENSPVLAAVHGFQRRLSPSPEGTCTSPRCPHIELEVNVGRCARGQVAGSDLRQTLAVLTVRLVRLDCV